MKRIFISALAAILAVLSTLALSLTAAVAADNTISFHYTFDYNLDPFGPGALQPKNVSAETLTLQYEDDNDSLLGSTDSRMTDRNGFARLMSQSAAPIWMQAKYAVPNGRTRVNVNFMARSQVACDSCITIVYVGDALPVSLEGFQTDFQSITNQWDAHSYQINLRGTPNPKGLQNAVISIGFANLDEGRDAGFEAIGAVQAIAIDNVGIEFEPIK